MPRRWLGAQAYFPLRHSWRRGFLERQPETPAGHCRLEAGRCGRWRVAQNRAVGGAEGRRRSAAESIGRTDQGRQGGSGRPGDHACPARTRCRRRRQGFVREERGSEVDRITCALCHSTVYDSFAPGIGKRLDGWPNRDLNVGAIIALSPDLSAADHLLGVDDATLRKVLAAWGPGKLDAEVFLDGKGFHPDGKTAAMLIPAAFGLAGVNLHTYTGWGSVPYWNAFVAINEMYGKGVFFDPRLDDAARFPVAVKAGTGHTRSPDDRVTSKLAALQFYQLAIPAPTSPKGSFDAIAAKRDEALFNGAAKCSACHVPRCSRNRAGTCILGCDRALQRGDEARTDRQAEGRSR